MTTVWMVTWRHQGEQHIIDFDDEADAHTFVIMLEEIGRRQGILVSVRDLDIDVEVRERIWRRIQERLKTPELSLLLKEAVGSPPLAAQDVVADWLPPPTP